jgi:YidC/Oxa1 family membrane protein insertase
MDNVRLFLWLTVLAMGYLAYTAWIQDYPTAAPAPVVNSAQTTNTQESFPPLDSGNTQAPAPASPEQPAAIERGQLIRVRTDVLDVLIDSHGGDLVRADLREYPVDKKTPDTVVRLLNDAAPELWVFQTGLRSATGGAEPNHTGTFRTASNDYTLAAGQDELVVSLDWVGEGPVSARKVYTFRRGQYGIDLTLSVQPTAGGSWRGAPYAQMVRVHNPPKRSYTSVDSYSFTGPVLYNGDRMDRLDFKKITDTPITQSVKGGWFAAIQHHFLAAAVPPPGDEVRYNASTRGQQFILSALGPVAESTTAMPLNYTFKLFVGPKLQAQLKAIGKKLDLTVDYGRLRLLAQPMFAVLSFVERWVNNWGWAIIIVTLLIKLAFYKLTAMSNRSMAKMRRLAPRIKAMQETYKDDRAALSQKMMELYKREKVNPAAGCLPLVIQMPFFFSFYWVLIESVEMRQAPFMLWINDLSSRDPYFVVPLLMGVAMYVQSRLSPAPPDPMQARVMQIMPVVFSAMFMLFPAGLVLYWLTNTLLSILQQWRINTVVARENAAAT